MDKSNSTIKAGCILFLHGWDNCAVPSIALRKRVRTLWLTSQKYQPEAARLKSNQVPYCLATNSTERVKNIMSLDVHRFLNSQEIKQYLFPDKALPWGKNDWSIAANRYWASSLTCPNQNSFCFPLWPEGPRLTPGFPFLLMSLLSSQLTSSPCKSGHLWFHDLNISSILPFFSPTPQPFSPFYSKSPSSFLSLQCSPNFSSHLLCLPSLSVFQGCWASG